MASIQVVLLNGTTADANEVMSNFNEIYSDIDQTNIGAANKTGTGKIVLDTSPTITGTPSFSGTPTFNAGITLPTTQRVNLNVGGTTRILESSANNLQFVVGGNNQLDITTTKASFAFDVCIASTQRLYLDNGGDTFLYEDSANAPTLVAGGSVVWAVDATKMAIGGSFALAIASGQRFYLDSGGDDYLISPGNGIIDTYVGGSQALRVTSSIQVLGRSLNLDATQRFYLDGGNDTYFVEGSANTPSMVAGGTTVWQYIPGATRFELSSSVDFSIQSTKRIYLDGGGDTYIYESSANVLRLVAGSTTVARLQSDFFDISTSGSSFFNIQTFGGSFFAGTYPILFSEGSTTVVGAEGMINLKASGDRDLINFYVSGVEQGYIGVSGGVVSYNTFTGGHWSQSVENIQYTRGTILSSNNRMCRWNDTEDPTLPQCHMSDIPNDPKVYGIFSEYDRDGDVILFGLGTGFLRVCDEGGNISVGDLIVTSSTPGVGMRQSDNLIKSTTVAKARESWNGSGEKIIACTIICG